jgi:hypothetical protein
MITLSDIVKMFVHLSSRRKTLQGVHVQTQSNGYYVHKLSVVTKHDLQVFSASKNHGKFSLLSITRTVYIKELDSTLIYVQVDYLFMSNFLTIFESSLTTQS